MHCSVRPTASLWSSTIKLDTLQQENPQYVNKISSIVQSTTSSTIRSHDRASYFKLYSLGRGVLFCQPASIGRGSGAMSQEDLLEVAE